MVGIYFLMFVFSGVFFGICFSMYGAPKISKYFGVEVGSKTDKYIQAWGAFLSVLISLCAFGYLFVF